MNHFFDCVHWRIVGHEPNCAIHRDPSTCGSCELRVGRNGNFHHPPVYYVPSIHPSMQTTDSVPFKRRTAPEGQKPCCQDKVMEADAKIRGLGDVVAKATSAVGIKPCSGCKKRQEALNKMFPFGGDPAGGAPKTE
jgi:hypothetical protein